ncbi:MAG: ATP-dependent Clp protease ATP-binding subunit [Bacteroidales bacterium]
MEYSDDLKRAVGIAQSIAREFSNERFSPAHLLKALLHKDIGLLQFLESLDKDFYFMEEWADVRIETYPRSSKIPDLPPADDQVQAVMVEADNIRLKLSKDQIDPLCSLISLSTPGVGFSYEQLKSFPVTPNELLDAVVSKADLDRSLGLLPPTGGKSAGEQKQNALLKYCIDRSALARQGKLDPVVGRDREIRMVAEVLGRRSKPNVLVIGDPGVGKTALVNGFVQNIQDGKVPDNLREARIFELDFGSLIAGASYKGEVEDRLRSIIREIEQFDKAILFIDEIHMLLDKQAGASGAANLLKPELARGVLTVIGTTSVDNFTKHIETDEAFNRQFEVVRIEEPEEEAALRMISQVAPGYEKHHNLRVDRDVISESIRLSKRYLKERCLPDAAIDLIDRTMSVVRMMGDTSLPELEGLRMQLDTILANEAGVADKELVGELLWFRRQIRDKISPVLYALLDDQDDGSGGDDPALVAQGLRHSLDRLTELASAKRETLEKSDVGAIVSMKTGIPLGKMQSSERDRLLNTEEHLKKRVVGQDHAIKSISEAILESRSGLSKAGQPIGSFFFLGPTGTGKTELAKTLAEFLFLDESSLIRFDMSEFKEEHSAALLYGAPPGYVGYEEGGLLVNKIRQQPYAVVLFDEIEKAHKSVFDIFLQILDEGKLHDRLGKEGDFSNSVVLFTSNIGSEFIVEAFGRGEIPKSNDLMDIMGRYFRPEFLGRLTEIVPFAPISEENVVKIFDIHLKNLYKSLDLQGIRLQIEPAAKEALARSGYNPKYGARPLVGVIRNSLRRPLSKMIIAGEVGRGDTILIKTGPDGEIVWEKQ